MKRVKKLFFKVATGEKGSEVRQFQINIGEGIVGYVAQTGEPLLIPDVSLDPRWDKRISEHTGFKTRSIACVPMKVDDKVIGVVELIDKEDGTSFTQDDIKMLLSIADLASRAIHNAREIDHFKRENRDLRRSSPASTRLLVIQRRSKLLSLMPSRWPFKDHYSYTRRKRHRKGAAGQAYTSVRSQEGHAAHSIKLCCPP
jgi:transcriptional regulator with GAF, ATPase, and Fis domain